MKAKIGMTGRPVEKMFKTQKIVTSLDHSGSYPEAFFMIILATT